jgi:hypothetical protein
MDNLRTMKRFLLFATLVCCAGVLSAQTDCMTPYDSNGDGAVTISGLLDLLGLFGDPDSDVDGICDDVDTCVGELDECGVCNGPGPTEIVIEDITILYDSVSEDK